MMQLSTAGRDMPANGFRRTVSAKALGSSVGGTVRQNGKGPAARGLSLLQGSGP